MPCNDGGAGLCHRLCSVEDEPVHSTKVQALVTASVAKDLYAVKGFEILNHLDGVLPKPRQGNGNGADELGHSR